MAWIENSYWECVLCTSSSVYVCVCCVGCIQRHRIKRINRQCIGSPYFTLHNTHITVSLSPTHDNRTLTHELDGFHCNHISRAITSPYIILLWIELDFACAVYACVRVYAIAHRHTINVQRSCSCLRSCVPWHTTQLIGSNFCWKMKWQNGKVENVKWKFLSSPRLSTARALKFN